MNEVGIAFLYTIIAGLATGLGGIIAIAKKSVSGRMLAISLAFAAGVMIFVSFTEILFDAYHDIYYLYLTRGSSNPENVAFFIISLSFFLGVILMAIFDKLIPEDEINIEDNKITTNEIYNEIEKKKLKRVGIMSAIAVTIHNMPEGIMVFLAAMINPTLGIGVCFAIAIHNIPEGIAIAAPIYNATGNRLKALKYAFLSGLSEPVGGMVAFIVLINLTDVQQIFPVIFAAVSGIMVYVSLASLLPTAYKFEKGTQVTKALFFGMAFMALSLVFLGLF